MLSEELKILKIYNAKICKNVQNTVDTGQEALESVWYVNLNKSQDERWDSTSGLINA
jgi:hypothetical protein